MGKKHNLFLEHLKEHVIVFFDALISISTQWTIYFTSLTEDRLIGSLIDTVILTYRGFTRGYLLYTVYQLGF